MPEKEDHNKRDTPMTILMICVRYVISQGLADSSVVARVTYQNHVEDYDLVEDGMGGEDVMAESLDDLLDAPSEEKAEGLERKARTG